MNRQEIQAELARIEKARAAWLAGQQKFNADVEWMLRRLIHEAVRDRMSAEEVARHSGLTVKRIRVLMRSAGLDPKEGKNLLSKKAADALAQNADLLGIDPREVDLMSPLAYLPMGEKMRRELRDKGVSQVDTADGVSGNLPAITFLREVRDSTLTPLYMRAEADQVLSEVFGIQDEDKPLFPETPDETAARAVFAFVDAMGVIYRKHSSEAVQEDMVVACARFGVRPEWFGFDESGLQELVAEVAKADILLGAWE